MHLFCSDDMFAEYGTAWLELAPGLVHVGLPAGRRLEPEEIERIDIAAFSGDLWQSGRSAAFFRVTLLAPNLRWLHMFSAGTDEPVFGELRAKGVKVTNSVGAAARSIAHSVIMQVLALSRHARPWALDQAARCGTGPAPAASPSGRSGGRPRPPSW